MREEYSGPPLQAARMAIHSIELILEEEFRLGLDITTLFPCINKNPLYLVWEHHRRRKEAWEGL